jgi:ferritin
LGGSNQYVNIAGYFDSESLLELAAFFYRQADEERMYNMKLVHFVVEAGRKVAIPSIDKPIADVQFAEHAGKLSLDWEL